MEMKYLHTGMPVCAKMKGMAYMDNLKVWITMDKTYNVEYLYFEPFSPMAAAIQEETHLAFQVEDIEKATKGKKILWPVTDIGKGAKIAFIYDKDLVVELYQA